MLLITLALVAVLAVWAIYKVIVYALPCYLDWAPRPRHLALVPAGSARP